MFALDALRQNRLRTLLSLLGVTIGIFTIIAVYSGVDTLRDNLQKSVNKLGSNSVYVEKWPWVSDGEYPWWKFMQRPVPKLRDFNELRQRSQTTGGISYEIGIDARTIKYGSNTVDGAEVNAVTHEHDKTWNVDLQDGRYFTELESQNGAPVGIIGNDIAENLFPGGTGLGKKIKVMGRYISIIGVFAKEGTDMLGISADKQVLIPLNFARNIIDVQAERYRPSIIVRGKDGIPVEEVKGEMRGLMRSIHSLRPNQDDNFALNESTMLTAQLDQVFVIINLAGGIIGIFSVLVGGFGIANIMFVSVKERTNIIGIQKSLGAKNYFILLQFLIESILLCLMGGLIGLAVVYGGTLY
ncbi:ABC transporter permease [Mucilaginibacter antarcticus]|uniref:ABC transporter permease n=1 Tax=Mucilaginibacter antarcticus TaxID=1855725 RepID=UPI00362E0D39